MKSRVVSSRAVRKARIDSDNDDNIGDGVDYRSHDENNFDDNNHAEDNLHEDNIDDSNSDEKSADDDYIGEDKYDEDVWDNHSIVIENNEKKVWPNKFDDGEDKECATSPVEVVQRPLALLHDRLPPDFFPCDPSSCTYHQCECMRLY